MSKTFFRSLRAVALMLVTASQPAFLHAQNASPSLQEQLEAQYPLAAISANGGCSVKDPQMGFVIQKKGVVGFPESSFIEKCASRYKNGKLDPSDSTCLGRTTAWLKNLRPDLYQNVPKRGNVDLDPGNTVYPIRLDVNAGKGEVKVLFGYCSGDTPPAPYRGLVIFQFSNDVMKAANVVKVEDTIAEVFKMQAEDQPQNQEASPETSAQNLAPQSDEQVPRSAPITPKVGQTVDEVLAAMGEPDLKAEGKDGKLVYVWKSEKVKIIFIDGKVADIE